MPGGPGQRRLASLLAVTAATLVLGALLKARCLQEPWIGGFEYRNFCYGDIQALYTTRATLGMPYVAEFNEYPVLTGLLMYGLARATIDVGTYMAANMLVLAPLALAVTWMLARLAPDPRRVYAWAAAPALALYAFYNWDLLAVAFTVAGLWAYRRGSYGAAGAWLGLGVSAKLYPVLLLPALVAALAPAAAWPAGATGAVRRAILGSSLRRAWRDDRVWWLAGGVAASVAAANLPFLLANPSVFAATYAFQFGRTANFETVWYILGDLGRKLGIGFLQPFAQGVVPDTLSWLLVASGLALSAALAWTRRLPAVPAAAVAVLGFLAFDKVLSLQYVLWVLPLLVLSPVALLDIALVLAADLCIFVALIAFNGEWSAQQTDHLFVFVILATLLRCGVYVGVLVRLARKDLRSSPGRGTLPPATGPGPEAAG